MAQTDDQQRRTSPPLSSPQTGILRSSELLGWRGIVVEWRYHPAGEYGFPSSSSHMIGLHLGLPLPVEQVRNGRPFANYASMRDVTARNAARARKELDYAQSHSVDLHVVELDVTSQESANWKTQCLPMRLQNCTNGLNKGIRSFKRHKVPNTR